MSEDPRPYDDLPPGTHVREDPEYGEMIYNADGTRYQDRCVVDEQSLGIESETAEVAR